MINTDLHYKPRNILKFIQNTVPQDYIFKKDEKKTLFKKIETKFEKWRPPAYDRKSFIETEVIPTIQNWLKDQSQDSSEQAAYEKLPLFSPAAFSSHTLLGFKKVSSLNHDDVDYIELEDRLIPNNLTNLAIPKNAVSTNIETLTISHSDISIKTLSHIQEFDEFLLSPQCAHIHSITFDTNFANFPTGLTALTKLTFLMTTSPKIARAPELGSLVSLKELILRSTALDTFPTTVTQLTNLEQLSLTDNNLKDIPLQEIKYLPSLQYLHLEENPIASISTHLPSAAPPFKQLAITLDRMSLVVQDGKEATDAENNNPDMTLNLVGRNLTEIPIDTIKDSLPLKIVNLQHNSIASISPDLPHLLSPPKDLCIFLDGMMLYIEGINILSPQQDEELRDSDSSEDRDSVDSDPGTDFWS